MRCMCVLSVRTSVPGTQGLCCKACWDSHAYSNLLLDMAGLNMRGACCTQGLLVSVFPPPQHLQHVLIKTLQGMDFTLAVGVVRPHFPSTSHRHTSTTPPPPTYTCMKKADC